jgi:hypothetical protein
LPTGNRQRKDGKSSRNQGWFFAGEKVAWEK